MSLAYKVITFEGKRAVFNIFPGLCKGCGLCREKCPKGILEWSKSLGVYGTPMVVLSDPDACTGCGRCEQTCPDCAIYIEKKPKEE